MKKEKQETFHARYFVVMLGEQIKTCGPAQLYQCTAKEEAQELARINPDKTFFVCCTILSIKAGYVPLIEAIAK